MCERALRLGVAIRTPNRGGRHLAATYERIEELGFDIVGAGEHVLFGAPSNSSFVATSFAAAVTSEIELLTTVTLVPLYPSGLLTKLVTMVDVVSEGRFNLGVGVGGEFTPEFDACGVDVRERAARTDESLAMLRALGAGQPVAVDGRFARVHGRMDPPPVRRTPLWIGGRRKAATERACTYGDVWMPHLVSPEQVAAGMTRIRQAERKNGRAPGSVETVPFCFVSVDADAEKARSAALHSLRGGYGQDFQQFLDRYVVWGTPDMCIDRLREYATLGASGFVLSPASDPDRFDDMVELIGSTILPAVHEMATSS